MQPLGWRHSSSAPMCDIVDEQLLYNWKASRAVVFDLKEIYMLIEGIG